MKDGKVPFEELSVSKKTTFDTIIKRLTDYFDQPSTKKARLLVDDQVISGLKLLQNLEEFGFQSGQLIYIEFLEANNTWPTDSHRADDDKLAEETPTFEMGKTNGLYNMGNTCYINAAMQCIVNIRHLHEYYVKDRIYMKQLNLQNRLGHRGDLVLAFANLM